MEVVRRTLFPYRLSQKCDRDFASVSSQSVHGLDSFCPLNHLFAERVKCFELFRDRLNLEAIQDTPTGYLISVEPNATVVTHIVCLLISFGVSPRNVGFQGFPQI